MDILTTGQQILAYPHGSPEANAHGSVILISSNQRSIAVAFPDGHPAIHSYHPEHGAVLLAYRETIGPWIEMFTGQHFEIEPLRPNA